VLTVDRHGNTVTVNLNEPQTIYILFMGSFVLPAFSLELSKYGGSIHYTGSTTLVGYGGASGMTIVHDELRFNANAVLSSSGILGVGAQMTDAFLIINGVHTFYPKAS